MILIKTRVPGSLGDDHGCTTVAYHPDTPPPHSTTITTTTTTTTALPSTTVFCDHSLHTNRSFAGTTGPI